MVKMGIEDTGGSSCTLIRDGETGAEVRGVSVGDIVEVEEEEDERDIVCSERKADTGLLEFARMFMVLS